MGIVLCVVGCAGTVQASASAQESRDYFYTPKERVEAASLSITADSVVYGRVYEDPTRMTPQWRTVNVPPTPTKPTEQAPTGPVPLFPEGFPDDGIEVN